MLVLCLLACLLASFDARVLSASHESSIRLSVSVWLQDYYAKTATRTRLRLHLDNRPKRPIRI